MKQRVCKICSSVMKKESTQEGINFFCKKCADHTGYYEAEMEPYCPECGDKISNVFACCGLSFFCGKCEAQKTASKIVWKKYTP